MSLRRLCTERDSLSFTRLARAPQGSVGARFITGTPAVDGVPQLSANVRAVDSDPAYVIKSAVPCNISDDIDGIEVHWGDGHKSVFHTSWLVDHRPDA